MKPLDKKQIPQVIGLAALALAFFGYFALKLILPTPAAAGTHATQTVAAAVTTPAPGAAPSAAQAPAADQTLSAPPPSPDLHDPFVPAISDKSAPPAPAPAVRTAGLKGPETSHGATGIVPLPFSAVPTAPALPGAHGSEVALNHGPSSLPGGLAPLAVAPPAPSWTVTGVLQSGSEHVAVLRNGDARRFVKQGDSLDGEFRVVLVTRQTVVLGHGVARFVLPLGGVKTAPVKPSVAPYVPSLPALPQSAAPKAAPGAVISRAVKPASPVTAHNLVVALVPAKKAAAPARKTFVVAKAVRQAVRRAVCPLPKVRVADYMSGGDVPAAPGFSTGGTLPVGTLAPDFSLATLDGRTCSLSQFAGKPVVLDFWASWDDRSVRMLSSLAQVQRDLGAAVTVVSVNTWDNQGGLRSFSAGHALPGVSLFDPSVSNESVAVGLYKAPDVPTCYVLDAEGRVAAAFVGHGRNTTSAIEDALAKLGAR